MRTLRLLHRWLGLLLALPLIIQGLSGAVLTLEPVIPTFRHPAPARALDAANQASQSPNTTGRPA